MVGVLKLWKTSFGTCFYLSSRIYGHFEALHIPDLLLQFWVGAGFYVKLAFKHVGPLGYFAHFFLYVTVNTTWLGEG